MKHKVTFLFGTGRCGSTLAQRLLNTSPQVIIWGEHQGFIKPIATGYFQLLQSKMLTEHVFQKPGRYSPSNIIKNRAIVCQSDISWMNNFYKSSLKLYFREFIESIFCSRLPSTITCWGFKEIRYGTDSNDISIDMLIDLFPESRNVIIIRHPFDTVISMLTAWNPFLVDESKNKSFSKKLNDKAQVYFNHWSIKNQKLLDYVHRFPDNFIFLRYEDFKSKFCNLVFNFVNISCPEDAGEILTNKVMQTKYSSRANIVRRHLRNVQNSSWKVVESIASQIGYEPYDI